MIHDEVATKAFMLELRELLKNTSDEKSKNKILEMLQTWGMAFRNSPKYRIVTVRSKYNFFMALHKERLCDLAKSRVYARARLQKIRETKQGH